MHRADNRDARSPMRVTPAGDGTGAGTRACRLAASLAISLAAAGIVAGCSSTIDRHGHQFSDTEIKQIIPGMTKEAVRTQAGTPDTTSTLGGSNEVFYYISSTKKTVAFMLPEEIDRKVLAVYFTPHGAVERVAHYGLKDGKVINLISRETPSHAAEQTLLKQLFRNLGYKQVFGD